MVFVLTATKAPRIHTFYHVYMFADLYRYLTVLWVPLMNCWNKIVYFWYFSLSKNKYLSAKLSSRNK